jgi:hypothetical protein
VAPLLAISRDALLRQGPISFFDFFLRVSLGVRELFNNGRNIYKMWITEQYFSPNLSTEDMRALVHSPGTDPLKPFSEACRDELKSIHSIHGDFVTAHFLKASKRR